MPRHEAVTGQEDADHYDCDDHVATASQNRGDGAAKVPDVGMETRLRKPPDAGCLKLKRFGPGLLKTGILLMLMMKTPTLIMKRTGPCLKTRSVVMYPMTMISGFVQMETCGDDNEPPDIEDEVGNNE